MAGQRKAQDPLRWMLDGEAPKPHVFKDAAQPLPEDPEEILAYVGDDAGKAAAMLEREKAKGRKARRGLVSALQDVVTPYTERPTPDQIGPDPDPDGPPEQD